MYRDLHEMLMLNDNTRQYFMKLPVRVQMTAHDMNDEIHTEEELHHLIDRMTKIHY
ncbi:MAG: hypothetical protein ACFWUD_03570 [Thermocaproicibacter melissae]|uniref:hypothetical protein n=1 Tax=Thermocaproicibacter melissae TaxID=2966552 RepID=UPI0024B06ADF|nr:hypothetical protein [Thermocaproicibacter melissae]WBY64504.1 hypothetical protein NOG13_01970 [Thermocaproicibacter melissae]